MASGSQGEAFSGFPTPQPQDGEERPGRAHLDWLISVSQLEDKTKSETVVLAQAGLEESSGPEVRKSK